MYLVSGEEIRRSHSVQLSYPKAFQCEISGSNWKKQREGSLGISHVTDERNGRRECSLTSPILPTPRVDSMGATTPLRDRMSQTCDIAPVSIINNLTGLMRVFRFSSQFLYSVFPNGELHFPGCDIASCMVEWGDTCNICGVVGVTPDVFLLPPLR